MSNKFLKELKSKKNKEVFFDEQSFNRLGYILLQQNKIKEAIAVFKLNVEAYPDSWNVYDSLAQAYLIDENKEIAIKFYKKS